MGITPVPEEAPRKPTLKTVGVMVVAAVRMRKLQQAWAVNKEQHEKLIKKLDAVRKRSGKPTLLKG